MRKKILIALAVIPAFVLILFLLHITYSATPVDELIGEQPDYDFDKFDSSIPARNDNPEVLILGSSHLAQRDHQFTTDEFDRVIVSLSEFAPDMVVAENLPPEYPRGKGRDYRPDFDLSAYSDSLSMSFDEADSLITRHRETNSSEPDPCRIAAAYLLQYDLTNAHYYAHHNECEIIKDHEELRNWLDYNNRHEMAEIGFPVARNNDIDQIVSFDYQGEEAEWFLFDELFEALSEFRLFTVTDFWPVYQLRQEMQAHFEQNDENLAEQLRFANSPEFIKLQYWAYEIAMGRISVDNAGPRQTQNYWLRNERMFDYLTEAAEAREPERILVIVGSGHKYFLDELAIREGYGWVDPRTWLPEESG